jgi:hypothetical protein
MGLLSTAFNSGKRHEQSAQQSVAKIELFDTKEQVRKKCGTPERDQIVMGEAYWYYGRYQICFNSGGLVTAINKY